MRAWRETWLRMCVCVLTRTHGGPRRRVIDWSSTYIWLGRLRGGRASNRVFLSAASWAAADIQIWPLQWIWTSTIRVTHVPACPPLHASPFPYGHGKVLALQSSRRWGNRSWKSLDWSCTFHYRSLRELQRRARDDDVVVACNKEKTTKDDRLITFFFSSAWKPVQYYTDPCSRQYPLDRAPFPPREYRPQVPNLISGRGRGRQAECSLVYNRGRRCPVCASVLFRKGSVCMFVQKVTGDYSRVATQKLLPCYFVYLGAIESCPFNFESRFATHVVNVKLEVATVHDC